MVTSHPCPEPKARGKDSASRAAGALPSLTQHTPILSRWPPVVSSRTEFGHGGRGTSLGRSSS